MIPCCQQLYTFILRDWSLITGRGGGATKREFYPYEKGGQTKFSQAEGGAQQVLG